MEGWHWALVGFAGLLVLYAAFVAWLLLAGRRTEARALAGFIPDCLILFRRLLGDERISRWRKLLLVALLAYLAMPIDLIPDFIPVAGQLDDAIAVALVLRTVLRGGGERMVRQHWPGPDSSLSVVLRIGFGEGGQHAR